MRKNNHIQSSHKEISFTSKRNLDEFLIIPAGKRSFISPPSSNWYQQSLSSFSILIGVWSSGGESGDDELDAGDVDGSSFFGIFKSLTSSFSSFNFDFLKMTEFFRCFWEHSSMWFYLFFFIFIGAHPRFCISLQFKISLIRIIFANLQNSNLQHELFI